MLKIPKGLKKKKKGKKSKRKGEDELFTEEELEKYRKEHQQQAESGEGSKENEEWSKFKDLTTGVDSILKKTQGDLDRIKSTSFFQRIPAGPKNVDSVGREVKKVEKPPSPPKVQIPIVTEADFKREPDTEEEKSEYGVTDDESEEDDQDDIFDTSYVEAVERGEVKLAYVPDSPEDIKDDGLFDTSYVENVIKGQDNKSSTSKKTLDIGVAVEVLTGRIDNVTITSKRSKRVKPRDLLLDSVEDEVSDPAAVKVVDEPVEKSILDVDGDEIPVTSPIDLSVSLHTQFITKKEEQQQVNEEYLQLVDKKEEEDDEFCQLAAESLETANSAIKVEEKDIFVEPVLQESWSVFEADKNEKVFAESVVEDQIDVDPFIVDQTADPFDTSFADQVVGNSNTLVQQISILEDDDDFDPRADEVTANINNRRKSSVHIHLTDPSGLRESISGQDFTSEFEESLPQDLLRGSNSDLTQLADSPLDPTDINENDSDPFDTTIVDKIVIPGKEELKFIEKELIGHNQVICRSPSDPDFDPRADEPKQASPRRPSRPENLVVSQKSVVFDIGSNGSTLEVDAKKPSKPLTPYYTREISITEDIDEEEENIDKFPDSLPRSQSNQDLSNLGNYQSKRRHSEYPKTTKVCSISKPFDLLESDQTHIPVKVLTPLEIENKLPSSKEIDPFDTSFTGSYIEPSKTELKLLAKEFSCEDTADDSADKSPLGPTEDDIFQAKALTPEPVTSQVSVDEDFDPFDTSFADNLKPGKTELKLLESELLN